MDKAPAATQIVVMATCDTTSDDKVGNMTIGGFQWKWLTGGLVYKHEDDYVIILYEL